MDILKASLDIQRLLSIVKSDGWELKEVRMDVDEVKVVLCKPYPSEVKASAPSA